MASGKWAQSGVPHKGWACVDIEDLGGQSTVCEMCEHQEIRYVHYMRHPDFESDLACGCDCAGKMEEDYARAGIREKKMKNRAGRKKAWPKLKSWYRTKSGNLTLFKDGYRVTIFKKGVGFSAVVSNELNGFKRFARRLYKTETSAQLASFEVVATQLNY
jgi:hypothetical protein